LELFRKKGKLTRMVILREIVINEPGGLKPISDEVGITQQAVSDYISKMRDERLVVPERSRGDTFRPTVEGVEFLQSALLKMKEYVDSTISELEIVRSTDAIADTEIESGQRVYLNMKGGLLYASAAGKSDSTGIADMDASPGDVIPVSSLQGVVSMEEGSLVIIEIQPARKGGGSARIDPDEFENRITDLLELENFDQEGRVNVLDMEAVALMKRSGIDFDMEMGDIDAVMDALTRGLSVIAIGTPYSSSKLIESLEGSDLGIEWKKGEVNASGSLFI
jgi:putative transcriptional regulator